MEALDPQIWEKNGVLAAEDMEDEGGKEEEEREESENLSSAVGSEEESDDDFERPPVRRKVSFADAFGFDLVSVKEFDNVDVIRQGAADEFYISCLFTVPSDPEELERRVQEQLAELERIELLQGTSILRGFIRVVNLCFGKAVYVRITLDGWQSHFDLLTEYVPGSSDRKTDQFVFQYTLVPPFDREGTRVEFCIRYETDVGVFWVNNQDFNYVMFCHQKSPGVKEDREKEQEAVCKEESHSQRGKRSCLRCSHRKDSAEEHANESSAIATDVSEPEAVHKAEDTGRKTVDNKEIHSILHHEEHNALMDSARSRRRAARLAKMQDQFYPPDDLSRKPHDHHQPHNHHRQLGSNSSYGFFRIRHKKPPANESPQILTYHQIPLLPLDWSDENRTQGRGVAGESDIWTKGKKMTLSKSAAKHADSAPTVSDLWEAFLNSNNDNSNDNSSVCDVWQDFLSGPDRRDHSSVPESEWLQSAASVSPSNHRESIQTPPATERVSDTAAHGQAHSLPECRLVSGPPDLPGPAGAGRNVSPRDDGTSRNSEGSPVIDTPCKFSPTGPTPVSGGSADSLCCQHVVGRGRGGREIVKGGGGEREEEGALTLHPVTSSGEMGTTEMTAIAESQNASAVDRISQGARPDEGLSSSGEGEVAGSAHNVACDTVAFRETIRLGTKDERRSVLFTSRQAGDEGQALSYTETKARTEKGIFRPQESGEAATSQGCADVKKCEEFRLKQNSESALTRNEEGDDGHVRSNEYGITEGESRQGPPIVAESKSNEAERENVLSDLSDSDKLNEAKEEEVSCHTAGHKAASQSSVEVEFKQAMSKEIMNDGEQGWSQTLVDTDLRRGEDDVGGDSRPQECTLKETVAEKDISCELRQTPETSEGMGGDMSQKDTGTEVSIGKLKIDALEEWMCDAENTPDQWKKLPKALTEQEVSAQRVECPRLQCEKLSEGTKDPIICSDITVLKMAVELGVEEEFTDRIDQGMDEGLAEEVSDWKDTPTTFERTGHIAEELRGLLTDTPDIDHSKQLNRAEDGLNEQFDSGVFSLVELAADLNPATSLDEDFNLSSASCSDCYTAQCGQLLTETVQTITHNENINFDLATCSNEYSTFESSWPLVETAPSSITSTPELISDVKCDQKWAAESDIGVRLDQSPLLLSVDQESANQIKYRALSHPEIGSQSEDCLVTHQESNNQSALPSEESLPSSSELDNGSRNVLAWRNVLFSISQVLLIAALFVTTLLYDFPSCFVFYVVSLCWWACQFRKHRVNNATKG